jgi:hypothetical protein
MPDTTEVATESRRRDMMASTLAMSAGALILIAVAHVTVISTGG